MSFELTIDGLDAVPPIREYDPPCALLCAIPSSSPSAVSLVSETFPVKDPELSVAFQYSVWLMPVIVPSKVAPGPASASNASAVTTGEDADETASV